MTPDANQAHAALMTLVTQTAERMPFATFDDIMRAVAAETLAAGEYRVLVDIRASTEVFAKTFESWRQTMAHHLNELAQAETDGKKVVNLATYRQHRKHQVTRSDQQTQSPSDHHEIGSPDPGQTV